MSKASLRQDGPPPAKRIGDRANVSKPTNDIQSLLQVVRSHQRHHEDGTYDASSIDRCQAMLNKLKKVLPKLLRPISTIDSGVAVGMLNDMCELLQLLIHARVCPHATAVFVDDARAGSEAGLNTRGAQRASAVGNGGGATQTFSTIATIMLYLVSFYCNERLEGAQLHVLDVMVQLVVLLQSRDVYASLHFFQDSVELLEDCFLLEECLRRTEHEPDATPASIACFLNTAIHAYHNSDGPLGSVSGAVLCGCVPVEDVAAMYDRKQQLKSMLPAIHVASYRAAIVVRRSIEQLVAELLKVSGSHFVLDQAYQRLCLLVRHVLERDGELLSRLGQSSVTTGVLDRDKMDIAEATCTLVLELLSISQPAERSTVRVLQAFFLHSSVYGHCEGLAGVLTRVLDQASSKLRTISLLGKEELWPSIVRWHRERIEWVKEFDDADIPVSWDVLSPPSMRLYKSMMKELPADSLWAVMNTLQAVESRGYDEETQASGVSVIHSYLSVQSRLVLFVQACAKSLAKRQHQIQDQHSSSARKRRRTDESNSKQPLLRDTGGMCEDLACYLIDHICNRQQSAREGIQALTFTLRVMLPLRPLADRVARVESQSIIRMVMAHVEDIARSCERDDGQLQSESFTNLVTLLLAHLNDQEMGRFRYLVERVISAMENLGNDTRLPIVPVSREVFFEMVDGYHALQDVSVDDSSASVNDWLGRCRRFSEAVFKMNHLVRRFFLSILVWKSSRALGLSAGSWLESIPGRIIKRLCTEPRIEAETRAAYASMVPMLLVIVEPQHAHNISRDRLLRSIVGLLAEAFDAQVQVDIRASCLESIQRAVCVALLIMPSPVSHRKWISCSAPCCPSPPLNWSISTSERASTLNSTVGEQVLSSIRNIQGGDSARCRVQALALAASVIRHCDPEPSRQLIDAFLDVLVSAMADNNRMIRRVAIHGLRDCVERVGFTAFLMFPEGNSSSSSVMEQLNESISLAMKNQDFLLLESCIEAIGAICCSNHITEEHRRELFVWGLLQLLALWINTRTTQSPVSTAVFDHMSQIFTCHNISWKTLFASYPEDLYFPVIDGLLRAGCLKNFVRTFFGVHFDEAVLLRDCAPFVLPQYVVDRQKSMLGMFVEAYKGEIHDDDVHMDDDELSELYPTSGTTLKDLVLHNIEYVVKELIIHQVEAESDENLVKEWEFFFQYMPENTTIRDAITHSPLRLLNLLAWELGGERSSSARKAFREISQYLIHGNGMSVGEVDAALMMPRQYFLALMTDLGNRISKKGSSSSLMHRIRAIRSIHRLFGMLKRHGEDSGGFVKGALDPFVPKVMAILKVGLNEKQLQAHAIQAWSVFVRTLTPKALESNFVSIVVSVLPCIPKNRHSLQLHGGKGNHDPSVSDEFKGEELASSGPSMDTAISILKYLFVDRRIELRQVFPRVRLIPPIAALDDVYASYVAEVGDPSQRALSEFVTSCLEYVTHWDLGVREIVLGELHYVLVARAHELRRLLQSEDDDVDSSVVDILFAILQVTRTDTSEAVRLLCAKCLGALGAIDGARIPLNVFRSSSTGGGSKDKMRGRTEYSTKDLACVLIENWLVKELRAAPENMDAVALSIQELLKFLAELTEDPQHSGQKLDGGMNDAGKRVKPQNIPAMPEWIKRRFERKDVLEFVEPYWYTNYSLTSNKKARVDTSTTFYEKFSTTYEEWLYTWCRRLIDLSQPPERKIFQACQMVLSTSVQIGRFLVPYLIQNVLRSGRPEVYAEVKREVMAVLKDDGVMDEVAKGTVTEPNFHASSRGGDDPGERAFGEYASRHHQCVQTIVSTIDELNEWVWNSEKKRLTLSATASRSTAPTPSRPADVPSDLDDQEKENLEEFLKDIPSQSLSTSAFRIKAYARALQYFEVFLRQQQPEKPKKDATCATSMPTFPVDLKLISKNATYLQQLYSRVDEPDALTGLATVRRLYDAYRHSEPAADRASERVDESNSSLTYLLHQVVDHEQLAQWEDALACYEQAIQEVQSEQASHGYYTGEGDSEEEEPRRVRHELADLGIARDPHSVKPALYSGIVQCLIQLGRLESALQHINGIVTQEPQFVGTLYPHALECAWRLSRWDLVSELLNSERQTSLLSNSLVQGGVSSRLRNLDVSQLSLVRVLHSFHDGSHVSFLKNLREARIEIMGPLAAACAESYQRAYPLLHKLHFLHEAEQGFISLHASKGMELGGREASWNDQCPWDARFELLPSSLKFRDPILALRRVMLQEANLHSEVSHNWLSYAKIARKEGFIRTANSAVMHAEALENPYASLEKAKLMVAQDRMYEALQILEPVDIDASKLDYKVEDPHYCAKNLLLATNWMQASGQRQGRKVIERYEAVIKFDPKWEKGYFFLAKYYEYLLSVSHPEAPTTISASSNSRNEDSSVNIDSIFHSHLINLMKNYILALSHGTKHVFQAMPRLLTLWFEYGEFLQAGSNKGASSANKALRSIEMELSQSNTEQLILNDITRIMDNAAESLPAYEWLVCFPQVTSRICHPNGVVVEGVKKIIMKVLMTYPAQAMWPVLGLSRSLNAQRRHRARDIILSTQRQFIATNQQEVATSFGEGQTLVDELISLAGNDPGNQRRMHVRFIRLRTKILVPVQAELNTVLPSSGLAPTDAQHAAFMPHSKVYIQAFSDKADVMMTKEKPKRMEIQGTDGKVYPFLCKREKTGDLRKDARMMEFNTMINKLLQKDREGRKRKLRLRTYAVVCLNEESGLMEWVSNTKAMRQLIGQIHKTERGLIQPMRLTHEIKERFLQMQKKHGANPYMLALYYRSKILTLDVFTPRFHQWFTNHFTDPTAWFEARLAFSRSAAVWSMVGHIIGLGDRHGENILIDCSNGECVHVDFDCLFDKGLKLAKPEIVPFRLTPNIIDAFGITGYEGVFRRVCEVTMGLLRDNRETLRSVLESFVHDPLVEWGRRGKNAQGAATAANGRGIADISTDRSKEETRIILKTIDDRLSGIYNLGDAIRPLVSSSHRSLLPENETLPLSVQGQVDKLIHEATSHSNLAQMYIGWMPFL